MRGASGLRLSLMIHWETAATKSLASRLYRLGSFDCMPCLPTSGWVGRYGTSATVLPDAHRGPESAAGIRSLGGNCSWSAARCRGANRGCAERLVELLGRIDRRNQGVT